MLQTTKDNGVSPVIAVLLILAMTVVAAGIVAVVTMGMTGDLQNGKEVGLLVKPAASGGDVLVTIVTGKDVPELTKLEVIDGGSADAKFQEVKLSGGGEVASFTAGAGYVAEKVAWPPSTSIGKTYTTPIVVRGTFADGTDVILLNTKLTFVGVKSRLDGLLNDLDLKDIDGNIILENIADLFLSGLPITINGSSVIGVNKHNLQVVLPRTDESSDQYLKMSGYTFWEDGSIFKPLKDSLVNKNGAINVHASQLDQENPDTKEKVRGVKIIVNSYDKIEYDAYLTADSAYNKAIKEGVDPSTLTKPVEPEPIGQQENIIYIDHTK